MSKPSEFTPHTSRLVSDLLEELFPAENVAVVMGGAETGKTFTSLPFDHILLTGSTPVGKAVMRAASENLVPVTLELGGKAPVIVAPGAATDANVTNIGFGKLANAGQTCIAPDYALVHETDLSSFRAAFDLRCRGCILTERRGRITAASSTRAHDRWRSITSGMTTPTGAAWWAALSREMTD